MHSSSKYIHESPVSIQRKRKLNMTLLMAVIIPDSFPWNLWKRTKKIAWKPKTEAETFIQVLIGFSQSSPLSSKITKQAKI